MGRFEEIAGYGFLGSDAFTSPELGWHHSLRQLLVQAMPAYLRDVRRGRRDAATVVGDFLQAEPNTKWEHVLGGLEFSHLMKRSDRAVNQFYWEMTHDPKSDAGRLLFEAMENPKKGDHNRSHLRRVEEMVEDGLNHTADIRHGAWEYQYWLPSLYLAIKFHDFVQLLSGKKEAHAELAALWLLSAHHQIAEASGIEKEHAWLLAKGAAIIILHHSNPEELEEPLKSVTDISPYALNRKISKSDKANLPVEFWIEYGTSINRVAGLKQSMTEGMSDMDRLVIKRFSQILGWADKADTAFPGDIGTARTSLAGPAKLRELYVAPPMAEGQKLTSVEDELGEIMRLRGGDQSDSWRKIFELTRKFTNGGSLYLEGVARHNMIVAASEAKNFMLALMGGDSGAIDAIFLKREWQLAEKLLKRNRVNLVQRLEVLHHHDPDEEKKLLKRYLTNDEFKRYERGVEAIGFEKVELYLALRMGTENPKVREYSEADRDRVARLFDLVIKRLCGMANVLPTDTVNWKYDFPFTAYDTVAAPEEMRRAKYLD